MPALTFLAMAGLVLTALLFVADASLEKNNSPVIVTSQRTGLPEPQYHTQRKLSQILRRPHPT
jgi:hypothetical protein